MLQGRGTRGPRAAGPHPPRRLGRLLCAGLALAALGTQAGPALGASGGGSLARSARPSHPQQSQTTRPSHGRLSGNPLARRAMWIWELPNTDGGSVSSIISDARRYGVGTLIVKSSDGTGFWSSQFRPGLVSALHRGGLRVCAWQYVYGNAPVTEAYMGAEAVRDGADCLIIDAETEYQGKYVQAQTYMTRLRRLIGAAYPVGLAGFPYVDYHPSFPYSVFLGPGGAQYNVPQMYWRDIGTTVDAVFAHTYDYNEIYQRRIFPLGQVYSSPPARQIIRFRQLSRAYGASGLSWWDWQEASSRQWTALSRPAGPLAGYAVTTAMATVGQGAQGDLVVWAQEHLVAAGDSIAVSGVFGVHTTTAVESFQSAHGLTADGLVGPETWAALLRYAPVRVIWSRGGATVKARRATVGGRPVLLAPVPVSASRPAIRDEIAGAGGAGGRPGR